MKTTILKSVLAIILLSTSLISCDGDPDTPTPVIEPAAILEYAEGGASSRTTVTNPIAYATAKEIFGRNSATEVVKIKLTSLAVATYTIGSGNEFTYTRPTTSSPWTAGSGTITITENVGNKISGTFNLTSGSSSLGINTVSGSFKRVIINP
jgi:Family of unknown function (DUF6252)